MVSKAIIRLNPAGIRELLNSSGVRAEVNRVANPVLAAAQAGAPVESGAYRGSLHIEEATTDRAGAHVVASVSYAVFVEARTGNLARSLDAARGTT